ncbi:MAG: hypothetical protein AAF702_47485 [Chloroflexota bacterium]
MRKFINPKIVWVVCVAALLLWSAWRDPSKQALNAAPLLEDSSPTNTDLYLPLIQNDNGDVPENAHNDNMQKAPDVTVESEFAPPTVPNFTLPTVKDRGWYFENWNLTQQDWDEWAKHLIEGDAPEPSQRELTVQAAAVAPPKLNLAAGQTAMQSSMGWGGVAGRAVDGVTDGEHFINRCEGSCSKKGNFFEQTEN